MAIKYKYMALKHKELSDKLKKDPLTTYESNVIDEVETYIDSEIQRQFTGRDVRIDLLIPHFDYDPVKKEVRKLSQPRKDVMRKELDKRYRKAGWKITIEYDDGLDGPNMSGPDLWILSGK
jgi:hypothetical protein